MPSPPTGPGEALAASLFGRAPTTFNGPALRVHGRHNGRCARALRPDPLPRRRRPSQDQRRPQHGFHLTGDVLGRRFAVGHNPGEDGALAVARPGQAVAR